MEINKNKGKGKPLCTKCGDVIYSTDWGYGMKFVCLRGHYSRPATYDEIMEEWCNVINKYEKYGVKP